MWDIKPAYCLSLYGSGENIPIRHERIGPVSPGIRRYTKSDICHPFPILQLQESRIPDCPISLSSIAQFEMVPNRIRASCGHYDTGYEGNAKRVRT